MTSQAMSATGRTASHRREARFRSNPTTLIAVTLFLVVLVAEAVLLAINPPSAADLGALAAVAGSMP